MIKVDQTRFGDKEGNCYQACLASVLELPIDDVPDIMQHDDHEKRTRAYLSQFGLSLVILDAEHCKKVDLVPPGYHLISGKSPRGDCWHAVVGYQGEMVHDPHPMRAGLEKEDVWSLFVTSIENGVRGQHE